MSLSVSSCARSGQTAPKIAWVERDSAEWHRMWDQIARWYGDTACENPDNGECWQYMGSSYGCHNGLYAWWHTFRHRSKPPLNYRLYVHVEASMDWSRQQEGGAAC